jgi:hypothetical protein
VAIAAGVLGCGGPSDEDPQLRQPLLVLDVSRLWPLLEAAETLSGTPLARESALFREALAGCTLAGFALSSAPGGDDFPKPACLDDAPGEIADRIAFAETRRGDADGLLLWPLGETGRLELVLAKTPDGDLEVDGFLRPDGGDGLDLLVPSTDAPASPVLRASKAFVYARLRPAGGLRLARLLPEGGQADRMFALKGRLLEGALLRGTLELAFLPPMGEIDLPLPIGALHHRGAGPIETALDEALDQLESTWPIRRTPRRFTLADGSLRDGACFEDLPLLPGLAPCWVVTPEALVVAWREAALTAALGPPDVASAPRPSLGSHALTVDLARIARDDRRRVGADPKAPHAGDLFSSLTVDLAPEADGARLRARLERTTR